MSHTYVTVGVTQATYDEISRKLRAASYDHVFGDEGEIDMHGLALVVDPQAQAATSAIIEAAELLEEHAEITRRCHVDGEGKWGDEHEAKADCENHERVAKSLREIV